ncbi:MAG TPA: hypothetical protein VGH89_40365 [Pseudonocardia sp.]|jgi:hypothetical protein
MYTVLVMAGLPVLAGAALWCIGKCNVDPSGSASQTRWYFGTYLTTAGGRTLIITGGGVGTVAIAVNEPEPPVPASDAPPPPSDATGSGAPSTTAEDPATDNRIAEPEPADLAELEQLWRLPSRDPSPSTTIA